ncbi:hypothetical protein QBC39DRAFT_247327 [Podospora conica]|nr:hypothetical protein QBC39DRAFT_247327 [Schizothecium conicum]
MSDEPMFNNDANGVNGINGEAEAARPEMHEPEMAIPAEVSTFSWLDPHPMFVIILVGPEEVPFGIQKDYLMAKSTYYRSYFAGNESEGIEDIVKLPDTPIEVFACTQNFLFTGKVFPSLDNIPAYDVLIGVWKLGHELGIEGLCDSTLEAMSECRRITQHIPATPLLVQVWQDTPEGSSIRKLLLSWAAEYMRSSDSRTEFARSLPQEVLSELVVAMSELDTAPLVQTSPGQSVVPLRRPLEDQGEEATPTQPPTKKQRHSDVLPSSAPPPASKPPKKTATGRQSLSVGRGPQKRRSNVAYPPDHQFTTTQKLNFCSDLLSRMLSGPGFWTRLVGPFKEPVDPAADGVPDYLEKVTRPMDLGTMKAKMDGKGYADEAEFLADMNQVFTNCYTYWSKQDPMWAACERLQRTFEEKYAQMHKWIAKMEGDEGQ